MNNLLLDHPDISIPAFAAPAAWHMQLDVSLNEEHVFLTLHDDAGRRRDLGERAHHYILLVLARLRVEDAARGIDRCSQGWVDMERLSTMIGLDRNHLNIQIFRARRQILAAATPLPPDTDVVERRRGEVRFGDFDVRIVRGARVEAELHRYAPVVARNTA
jgi:hypothetical protein